MYRLPLARRFLLLLAIPSALALGLGIWVLQRIDEVPDRAETLTRNLGATLELNHAIHREIQRTLNLIHVQFEHPEEDFPERFHALNYDLGAMETRYLTLEIGERERLAVERIRHAHGELGIHAARIYSLLRSGERDRAREDLEGVHELASRMERDFTLLNDVQLAKLEAVMENLRVSLVRGHQGLVVLGACVLALLGLVALELRRRILDPVRGILEAAGRIREGEHEARAPVLREDELGRLARGFNFMADRLMADQEELERRVEDRTRRLETLQATLVQSAKMSALGELVGGVAHELNNPLTAILGFAELSRDRSRGGRGGSSVVEMQETIVEQVRRCQRIIGALTQFGRRERPRLEAVRLNALVERILALREYELGTRNVRLLRDLDPSDPVLAADSYKLEQVVLNLLNNAHDAIRQGGRSGTIRLVTRAEEEGLRVSVEDDGPGILEPDRVFEPFYTTKDVGQGTGLGLSVCYGIVEEHGGEIRAENLERGARFTVVLPRGSPEELEEVPPAAAAAEVTAMVEPEGEPGISALIVEDEPLLLDLQLSFLRAEEVDVLQARSAEEAIRLLETRRVDLVVSDVRMPGRLDGLGLYRWILEHRPELRRRFAFISGDLVGLEDEDLLRRYDVPLLQKPFTLQDYSATVQVLLDGCTARKEASA